MKTIITISFLLIMFKANIFSQEATHGEKYANTLNLGLGIGGYSGNYWNSGRSLPVFHINYELNAGTNFTLAPFISFYTYTNSYYWGDNKKNYPYKYYYYRETVIPIGLKGTYYFDQLLNANSKWDFYLAASLGFVIVNSSWDNDYYGDKNYYHHSSHINLDFHIGTEYHLNNRLGIFLDLSSGVSTIGLAIHQK